MRVTLFSKDRDESCEFECAPGERLLHAALRAGVPMRHECATGTCGTCKVRLVSGAVECLWSEAPGRRFLNAKRSEILACQCTPQPGSGVAIQPVGSAPEPAACPPFHTRGRVRRSGMLTHDVLILELELAQRMRFLAGQFVVLAVEGLPGYRAYSIVNFKADSDVLELIVKRKPDGGLSDRLFDRDITELDFHVFGPLGRATFDASAGAASLVCAAGGTGIAGIMSILACASSSGHLEEHQALVCFGVRGARDLFFLDRLAALRRRHPDTLRVVIATSDEDVPRSIAGDYHTLTFERGLVNDVLARQDAGSLADPMAYVAGPPAAVEAMASVLLTRERFPPERLRFDRFG